MSDLASVTLGFCTCMWGSLGPALSAELTAGSMELHTEVNALDEWRRVLLLQPVVSPPRAPKAPSLSPDANTCRVIHRWIEAALDGLLSHP